jgi:hypothetical protein
LKMPLSGGTVSLGLFLLGLLGIGFIISGGVVASHKRDHFLGGVLMCVGFVVLAVGFLGPASQ